MMLARALVTGESKLPNYRLYRLDGAGRISTADWVDADDDDEARAKAVAQCPSGSFELWHRKRLVQRTSGAAE
jgi:hypothetical protein